MYKIEIVYTDRNPVIFENIKSMAFDRATNFLRVQFIDHTTDTQIYIGSNVLYYSKIKANEVTKAIKDFPKN